MAVKYAEHQSKTESVMEAIAKEAKVPRRELERKVSRANLRISQKIEDADREGFFARIANSGAPPSLESRARGTDGWRRGRTPSAKKASERRLAKVNEGEEKSDKESNGTLSASSSTKSLPSPTERESRATRSDDESEDGRDGHDQGDPLDDSNALKVLLQEIMDVLPVLSSLSFHLLRFRVGPRIRQGFGRRIRRGRRQP